LVNQFRGAALAKTEAQMNQAIFEKNRDRILSFATIKVQKNWRYVSGTEFQLSR